MGVCQLGYEIIPKSTELAHNYATSRAIFEVLHAVLGTASISSPLLVPESTPAGTREYSCWYPKVPLLLLFTLLVLY